MDGIQQRIADRFSTYLLKQQRFTARDAKEAQDWANDFIADVETTYPIDTLKYLLAQQTVKDYIDKYFQSDPTKDVRSNRLAEFQQYFRRHYGTPERLVWRLEQLEHQTWYIVLAAILAFIVLIYTLSPLIISVTDAGLNALKGTPIAYLLQTWTPSPTASPTSIFTPTQTQTPTVTPTPTDTSTPTLTPTPISIPMAFAALKIIDTGVKGGICGYSKEHSIVRDLEGNLHIFFVAANEPTNVYETISKDNGETWSASVFVGGFVVQGTIIGFSCSVAVDPQGNIHVLFDLDGNDIGYTLLHPGGTWQDARIRGQGLPDVGTFAANLATGLGDQIHAVFSSKKLWYTYFDGNGWSSETEIVPGGWHPDIFVDNNNGRHVVYNGANFIPDKSGNGSSSVTVYYTYSADGIHWTDEQAVPPDDGIWKGDAAIKVDSRGRRHITYTEWAPLEGNLFYTYSDDGHAWSMPRQLNTEPGVTTGNDGNESAAMELDPNDNLYVVSLGLHGPAPQKDNWLTMRWLNNSTQLWSDPIYIAKVAGGVGDEASLPYQVFGWTDKNSFTVDMAWNSAGEIYYGRAEFKK